MTEEERDVLFEYVEYVKSEKVAYTASDFKKRLTYDFNHGKDASVRILDKYFLDIVSSEDLTESQYDKLASIIGKLDRDWILVSDISEINWDDIVVDRMGYVILKDGTRVDVEPDQFKEEREAYNKRRIERNERKRS